MHSSFKRHLALLMVFVMCLSLMPSYAFAEDAAAVPTEEVLIDEEPVDIIVMPEEEVIDEENQPIDPDEFLAEVQADLTADAGTIEITPTTDKPNVNKTIAIGDEVTVQITNTSSRDNYDFSIKLSKTGVANTDAETVNVPMNGGTGTFKLTGVADGKVVVTISNDASSYARVGTITLTVGEGEPEPDVEVTPTTAKPSVDKTIAVGEEITVQITNTSTSSDYDYSVKFSKSGVATADPTSVSVAKNNGTGTFKLKGVADGKVTVTISNDASSRAREATINLTVGTGGGGEPTVTPDVTLTPTTANPTVTYQVDVSKSFTVEITNGGSSAYDFKASVGDSTAASVSPASVNIAKGETAIFTVTGLKDATTTVLFENENSYGSSYARQATINLTVGNGGGGEPTVTPDVELTPTTAKPSVDKTIAVGEEIIVQITNTSTSSDYDYSVKFSKSGVATADPTSVSVAKNKGTGTFKLTGVADGKVTVTISNDASSRAREATINLTVGNGGGGEPTVTPDVTLTPTTANPTVTQQVDVSKSFTVEITNGGSSDYDFNASVGDSTVASVSPSSINIAEGETAIFTVTGIKAGSTTVLFENENSYGSSYTRKATINLTVGTPTTPPTTPVTGTYLAFCSDVHNDSDNSSADRLESWINTVTTKLGSKLTEFGFCGDLGPASGTFWPYAANVIGVVEDSDNVIGNGFMVCGNHEWSPGNFGSTSNETTAKYTTNGNYVEADNYVLYSMGVTSSTTWNKFDTSDITKLGNYLESAPTDKPIFVLSHYPLHNYSSRTITNKDSVISTLNEYSGEHTIIFLWGHNHTEADTHYNQFYTESLEGTDIDFTYCSAGCLADDSYGSSSSVNNICLTAAIDDDSVYLCYYKVDGSAKNSTTVEIKGAEPSATRYTITASATGNGTISPSGSVKVKEGSDKEFTFTPESAQYMIESVKLDGTDVTSSVSNNKYTVKNVTADHTLAVTFVKDPSYTGPDIELTPTTANPSTDYTVDVGKSFVARITNGSTSSTYTFKVSIDEADVVSVDNSSASIKAGEYADFKFTGLKNGETVITIKNSNSSSSSYDRKATINLTVGTPEPDPTPDPSGTVYVAFSSDTHHDSSRDSVTPLNSWISGVTTAIGSNFDNMGFTGDIGSAYDSGDSYWSDAQSVINAVRNSTKVNGNGFFVPGNHEWQSGNFATTSNATKSYYTVSGKRSVADNYVLYSLGATSEDQEIPTSEITKLGNYLSTAPTNVPIFVLSHYPLHYCSSGSSSGWGSSSRSTDNASSVIDTLNQYASTHQIVFLWGHNHTLSDPMYDEVYTSGSSIKYSSSSSKTINFTYAASGCMSDESYGEGSASVEGKGLVVKIVGGQLSTMTYYDKNAKAIGYIPTTYTVTYNANGGSDAPEAGEKTENVDYVITSDEPTWEHHNFLGWATTDYAVVPEYKAGDKYTADADITLYAVWELKSYSVTFENYDGSVLQTGSVVYGEMPEYTGATPTKPADSKYTYSFKGWDPELVAVSGDAVYTAQFNQTAIIPVPLKKLVISEAKKTVYVGQTYGLSVSAEPVGASTDVVWKSSNTKVATVDPETGVVNAIGKGSTTITAVSSYDAKKTAKCSLKVLVPVSDIEITSPQSAILAGKSVQFKAVLNQLSGVTPGDKTITWSFELPSGSPLTGYVSINKSGKLSISKSLPAGISGTITVKAVASGCEVPMEAEPYNIEVVASPVQIIQMWRDGVDVSKGKDTLWLGENDQIVLSTKIFPEATACKDVDWKSSNAKVAVVVDGVVTALNKGSATITATSRDGAKKSVKYTVNVKQPVTELEITSSKGFYVTAGSSLTLKTTCNKDASDKKVTWSIVEDVDESLIKISSSGKLTVGKAWAGNPLTVTVKATAVGTSRVISDEKVVSIIYK